MSNVVTSIRDSVKYVKSSQGRKQRFEKMIKEVGISCDKRPPLDVPTRWNSTYHMLKCALEYERAFEALTREDSQYVHEPLVEEWKMAKKLCDILKTFCDATEVLSGSNYPTTSCIFDQFWEVKLLLEKESSNTDVMIAAMIHKMKEKLQKYWDICFLQICVPVILDPRFKLGFLKFRLSKCFGETSQYFPIVERTFRDLFDEYNSQSSDCTQDHANSVGSVETNVDRSNPWADWSLHQNLRQMRREGLPISELFSDAPCESVSGGFGKSLLSFVCPSDGCPGLRGSEIGGGDGFFCRALKLFLAGRHGEETVT
ncbi:zinc finger BED domain-containing protein RICESLEEPER 2-like [Panicum virgatum]|uniref:zinc finger BED domain-containing protein RICESLEEPER 2-like n=1 Tax=Panicum virgatum TaxID=38727 RepID=UPI0019D60C40|nr:zinc finger BED domain-containing protein RICESLEEPER 2-like [Panicum virgatum]